VEAKVGFTDHYFCTEGFALETIIFFSIVPVHYLLEALKLVNAFEK